MAIPPELGDLDPHQNESYSYLYNPEKINGEFTGKHILSVEQFARPDLEILFSAALRIKEMFIQDDPRLQDICRGKVMIAAFEEASTRTDLSFQSAMFRLGGGVAAPVGGWKFSSEYKGEGGVDTLRAEACYGDVIILRHPDKGSTYRAAYHIDQLVARGDIDTKPVLVSAGDGVGEHPTQALLDLFTILDEKGRADNLIITLVGDLKHGRTVHSLAKLLVQYQSQNIKINLVSPQSLAMPQEIIAYLEEHGVLVNQTDNISTVIAESDVVYWTRVQEERFTNPQAYEAIKNSFILTPSVLNQAKPDAIFMHPLPRKNEMGSLHDHDILDADPRTRWFRQMENGMYIRMALLAAVTGRLDRIYQWKAT